MRVCLERTGFLIACLFLGLVTGGDAHAEIFVRWDQDEVISRDHLGVSALVIPAANQAAVRSAAARGFDVYLEVDASALATFTPAKGLAGVVVKGRATAEQLNQLRGRAAASGARVLSLDDRAQWPHIRSNVVTLRNDVLQVGSRTAQPWLEHNVALIRLARAHDRAGAPLLSYRWNPSTASEAENGPPLEKYLVAIAEAGSTGADLVLPLHERLQNSLLLGKPAARAWWRDIRRYIDFYSWSLAGRYRPLANIGIVTADPSRRIEEMKLLTRHNLPYAVIDPGRLQASELSKFRLLLVLEPLPPAQMEAIAEFARKGRTIVVAPSDSPSPGTLPWRSGEPVVKTDDRVSYTFGEGRVVEVLKRILDPNRFALDVRDLLGRENRIIDIWNGITVLAVPYEEPGDKTLLVTVLNYAHEVDTVQLRVAGTYSIVEYESPEQQPALLPYTHRDGFTEFVLPALRVGGRVFLSRQAGLQ